MIRWPCRLRSRGFELDLGQVSGGDADGDGATTPEVSFTNADAVSLQLNNVSVFAGVGGVLTLVGHGGRLQPLDGGAGG